MPILTAEVRQALVASIKEFGVVCPVIKDQTGEVLDGRNRIAIATELGITYPETIYHCTPDQRAILKIELNGARRQITADQWKPLVDHLRSLTLSDGSKFSERAIAQAVGVARSTVKDYKPIVTTGRNRPVVTKSVGKDGKARTQNKQWTATDRVLHLIRQSSNGLTTEELRTDEVLRGFGSSTVSTVPPLLRERGLIEDAGFKRGRFTVWRAVTTPVTPPSKPKATPSKTVARKADQVVKSLQDPKVRDAVKQSVASDKGTREAKSALRAAEKELEAAILDEEKRQADEEKERLRLIEVARQQADKSIKTWDKLIIEVRAAWTVIAAYTTFLDDLPAINPSFERILGRELEELRRQMDWLEDRLYPGRNHVPVQERSFIDV
jgi:ParB-like chromosome segregation protein Spo0J